MIPFVSLMVIFENWGIYFWQSIHSLISTITKKIYIHFLMAFRRTPGNVIDASLRNFGNELVES